MKNSHCPNFLNYVFMSLWPRLILTNSQRDCLKCDKTLKKTNKHYQATKDPSLSIETFFVCKNIFLVCHEKIRMLTLLQQANSFLIGFSRK